MAGAAPVGNAPLHVKGAHPVGLLFSVFRAVDFRHDLLHPIRWLGFGRREEFGYRWDVTR